MSEYNIKNIINIVLIVLYALGTIFACLFMFRGISNMVYVSLSVYATAFAGLIYSYICDCIEYTREIKKLSIIKDEENSQENGAINEKQQVVKRINNKRIFAIIKASLSFLIAVFCIIVMFLY